MDNGKSSKYNTIINAYYTNLGKICGDALELIRGFKRAKVQNHENNITNAWNALNDSSNLIVKEFLMDKKIEKSQQQPQQP